MFLTGKPTAVSTTVLERKILLHFQNCKRLKQHRYEGKSVGDTSRYKLIKK